jgi:hypothetical protein
MTVAVGRLQFSITMTAPRTERIPQPEPESALERIARKDRQHEAANADRSRWITTMLERAGRPF